MTKTMLYLIIWSFFKKIDSKTKEINLQFYQQTSVNNKNEPQNCISSRKTHIMSQLDVLMLHKF
jgi:hypothetical protein